MSPLTTLFLSNITSQHLQQLFAGLPRTGLARHLHAVGPVAQMIGAVFPRASFQASGFPDDSKHMIPSYCLRL